MQDSALAIGAAASSGCAARPQWPRRARACHRGGIA
ncbi:hypothetical protein [Acidovorax sp. T1]